mmetsp:Transcript_113161/g.365606  ORF Transcript_113161/g.365606 Transcript_113161/m.365606 type:complete len:292 (+) Transcript_113161:578-1453(+)
MMNALVWELALIEAAWQLWHLLWGPAGPAAPGDSPATDVRGPADVGATPAPSAPSKQSWAAVLRKAGRPGLGSWLVLPCRSLRRRVPHCSQVAADARPLADRGSVTARVGGSQAFVPDSSAAPATAAAWPGASASRPRAAPSRKRRRRRTGRQARPSPPRAGLRAIGPRGWRCPSSASRTGQASASAGSPSDSARSRPWPGHLRLTALRCPAAADAAAPRCPGQGAGADRTSGCPASPRCPFPSARAAPAPSPRAHGRAPAAPPARWLRGSAARHLPSTPARTSEGRWMRC